MFGGLATLQHRHPPHFSEQINTNRSNTKQTYAHLDEQVYEQQALITQELRLFLPTLPQCH